MADGTLEKRRPRVGVVMGSGGTKALAGVALFEFLDSIGVTPDLLVGCSGGGIMCALRGCDYSTADMRKMFAEFLDKRLFDIDYRALLAIGRLPFGHFDVSRGIIKPKKIQAMYRKVFGERRLEDLKIPTVLQTTDLLKSEAVVLSSGLVADAVYASGAEYPFFPLICIDGRWLADGEFTSSLPILEAVKRQMDVIIAIRIQTELQTYPRGFNECFGLMFNNIGKISARLETPLAISLHHHEIINITVRFNKSIHPWDVNALPTILNAGEEAVAQMKQEIIYAIENFTSHADAD
ncbi:patatin-like phospholipase family protein [Sporomusa malonica]|uniref:NTE family protein n=1 Tax=Sporomusa malonica TaxID=112901 RepID=A0A1W1ZN38_9FIRM|nr:patatin-like phospholipase family protein [Sporomusa malonica]SMC49632.1 NTE family protein [Sporomusa malonica]